MTSYGQGYYEAIAQLLPVLLLVIAVEARLSGPGQATLDFIAIPMMGFVALGELCALRALALGDDTVFIQTATASAVATGLIFIPVYFALRMGKGRPVQFLVALLLGLAMAMAATLMLWPSDAEQATPAERGAGSTSAADDSESISRDRPSSGRSTQTHR